MSAHLRPEDDGLATQPVKTWSTEKLDYLKRYLGRFVTAMRGKPWRALNYIDLFSGPGKCQEESGTVHLGSPLLAVTARNAFDHYFYVDQDPDNIQVLRQRCADAAVADRIQYFAEDSNVAVCRIADVIGAINRPFIKGRWSCLNLAFLDPYGLDLQWDTVKILAELRTDLIIHYSQMGLQRYMPVAIQKDGETVVDRFFGGRRWRDTYRQGKSSLYSELIGLYKQNLVDLGYVDVRSEDEVLRIPMMRNTKNAPLYCLVFASKSKLGERFWRDVTQRDIHGQQRLF